MPRIKFHNAANLQGTAKKKYDEDEDFEENKGVVYARNSFNVLIRDDAGLRVNEDERAEDD